MLIVKWTSSFKVWVFLEPCYLNLYVNECIMFWWRNWIMKEKEEGFFHWWKLFLIKDHPYTLWRVLWGFNTTCAGYEAEIPLCKLRRTARGCLTFQAHVENLARDITGAGIKENTQHKRQNRPLKRVLLKKKHCSLSPKQWLGTRLRTFPVNRRWATQTALNVMVSQIILVQGKSLKHLCF